MKYNKGFPDDLVALTYSLHSKQRLIERTTGSLILAPQYIRLTQNNTKDVVKRNGKVVKATVYINYKKGIRMCLPVLIPSGIVKTVYFEKDSTKKRNYSVKKHELPKETEQTKESTTEITGEGGLRENVEFIQPTMGGKESKWNKLFRALWRKNLWGM